jgi:1,4-alpha-glucan branching enzyme
MLRKQNAAGGKVKVTFSRPPLEGVTGLFLVGSFNDWSDTGTPLVRGADGGWSVALTLDAGWAYQYRFRDQDGGWHNDWAADSYVPNEFGSENSVVDLTGAAAGPAEPAAAKKTVLTPAPKPAEKPAKKSSACRGKKKY